MNLPTSLNWLAGEPGGSKWLQDLPQLIADALAQWNLRPSGSPYTGGNVSYVAPVARGDERFVLKVQWPHEEAKHEADALREWRGCGAVRLVAHDPMNYVLLLEECIPGAFLADSKEADPIAVLSDLLPRLWIETDFAFRTLADEAAQWAENLPMHWEKAGKPCERCLIDEALRYIDLLSETQGQQVLLHQDLHGHNILSAQREPWLAIDPKPLCGEREFSLAPIVRSSEFGHSAQATLDRLERLSAAHGLDRDRALGWTVAQTMAWGFGGAHEAQHHQTVRWLIDAR